MYKENPMKKRTKALAIVLTTFLMTESLLAITTTTTEQPDYIKQLVQLKEIYHNTYDKPSSTKPYNLRTRVIDQYGNILGVNSKWHESTSINNPEFLESRNQAGGTVTYTIARPYYYQMVDKTLNINSAIERAEILLEPSKVVNTVTGQVKGVTNISIENLYIAVRSPKISEYNQDALLKVKSDGTFKINNLMDGTYTLTFVKLTDKDDYKPLCTTLSEEITVTINKNTVLDITYLEKYNSVSVSYFKDLDRSNPMLYAKHTAFTQPPQLLVDMAKKVDSATQGKSDFEKVKAILKAMNNSSVSRRGTIRNHAVADIVKDGKIYYESCGDYANVFMSLAIELGMPVTCAQAVQIGNDYKDVTLYKEGKIKLAEAHQNVELYLRDEKKWILIDPHFCVISTDYNPANPYVAYKGSEIKLPEDSVWYFYIKASANNEFKKPHEFVLEHIDTSLSYEPQHYDLKLSY